jgi:hypothetical protein
MATIIDEMLSSDTNSDTNTDTIDISDTSISTDTNTDTIAVSDTSVSTITDNSYISNVYGEREMTFQDSKIVSVVLTGL